MRQSQLIYAASVAKERIGVHTKFIANFCGLSYTSVNGKI